MPFFKKTKKVKKELPKIDVIQTDITELQLKPFPHQNVQNFLKPDFFEDINKYLYQILSRGILSADAPRDPTKFTFFPGLKNTSYFQLTPECGYPMNQFMTKTWIEYFSILYDMPLTNTLAMSFHHHSHNSGGRHAHTDYHLIGFPKSVQRDDPNELVVYNDPTPYYSLVVNDREKASHLGLDVQMRECAALIYLNPPYKAFTGGETGLFENYQQYVDNKPLKKYLPIPNSITTFETSPHSYHTYLPNTNVFRNVLSIWFHIDPDIKLKQCKGVMPLDWRAKSILDKK